MTARRRPNRDASGRPPAVPDVETIPCPSGGLHVIVWRRQRLVCRGCGESWAALDAGVREAS